MPRAYPDFPRIGVGAVVVKDEQVLLIKRKSEPKAGKWTLPGGVLNLGETLQDAVQREISEECGIRIKPTRIVDVLDVMRRMRITASSIIMWWSISRLCILAEQQFPVRMQKR